MNDYQQLMIEETPTDELTMAQMQAIAEPFDVEEDCDILGEILTSFEGVGE